MYPFRLPLELPSSTTWILGSQWPGAKSTTYHLKRFTTKPRERSSGGPSRWRKKITNSKYDIPHIFMTSHAYKRWTEIKPLLVFCEVESKTKLEKKTIRRFVPDAKLRHYTVVWQTTEDHYQLPSIFCSNNWHVWFSLTVGIPILKAQNLDLSNCLTNNC